jgi:hypothetical protein
VALEEKEKQKTPEKSSSEDLKDQIIKLELVVKAQQASIVTLREKISGQNQNDVASILLRMAKQDARIAQLEEQLEAVRKAPGAQIEKAEPQKEKVKEPEIQSAPLVAKSGPKEVQSTPGVKKEEPKKVEEKKVEEKPKKIIEEKKVEAEKVEEKEKPVDVLALLGESTAPPLTSIKKGGARKGTRRIPTKKLAELSAEIEKEEKVESIPEELLPPPPVVEEAAASSPQKKGGSTIARRGGMGFNLAGKLILRVGLVGSHVSDLTKLESHLTEAFLLSLLRNGRGD